jgi:putative transcriptional regulator
MRCENVASVLSQKRKYSVDKKPAEGFVSDEVFAEIEEGFGEALDHARGNRADLRTTRLELPPPPQPMDSKGIVSLRKRIHCSQHMFAQVLNVSPRTVQAWEQGQRQPSEAALRLLDVIGNKDAFVAWFEKLESYRQGSKPRGRRRSDR